MLIQLERKLTQLRARVEQVDMIRSSATTLVVNADKVVVGHMLSGDRRSRPKLGARENRTRHFCRHCGREQGILLAGHGTGCGWPAIYFSMFGTVIGEMALSFRSQGDRL